MSLRIDHPVVESPALEKRLPDTIEMQSTGSAIVIRPRTDHRGIVPTVMTWFIAWVLGVVMLIAGGLSMGSEVPAWYDRTFGLSLACLVIVALVAHVFDRLHLRVDRGGISLGVRPLPVDGYPFSRFIPTGSIAGIYVSHSEWWLRYSMMLLRSFEVHALTTDGEAVCLLKRLKEPVARDIAAEIRRRLGSPPQTHVPLRDGMRGASEMVTRVSGLPAWLLWCGFLVIGAELAFLPYYPVLGWQKTESKVIDDGYIFKNGRSCKVLYTTSGGPLRAEVANRCPNRIETGDSLTVYYDPARPGTVRRVEGLWPIGLIFALPGGAGVFFCLHRPKLRNRERILFADKFKMVTPYWKMRKQNARAANGVLSLTGPPGSHAFPFTGLVFDPGAIELQVAAGNTASPHAAAGILFGYSTEGIGYVFSVAPQSQTAYARRFTAESASDLMPPVFVKEIDTRGNGWNSLRVEIADDRADLFVNGARVGSAPYEAPLGGGMAGLHADFGGTQMTWKYSDFAVLA